jgi:hypothetical protein
VDLSSDRLMMMMMMMFQELSGIRNATSFTLAEKELCCLSCVQFIHSTINVRLQAHPESIRILLIKRDLSKQHRNLTHKLATAVAYIPECPLQNSARTLTHLKLCDFPQSFHVHAESAPSC